MDSEKVARKLEKRWKTLENQEKLLIGRICVAFECFLQLTQQLRLLGSTMCGFTLGTVTFPV